MFLAASDDMTSVYGPQDASQTLFWLIMQHVREEIARASTSSGLGRMGLADMKALDDCYVVSVDVPGVTKPDISVKLSGRRILITGERVPQDASNEQSLLMERYFGPFKREFMIPSDAYYLDKTQANLQDGVLTVVIPRRSSNTVSTDSTVCEVSVASELSS